MTYFEIYDYMRTLKLILKDNFRKAIYFLEHSSDLVLSQKYHLEARALEQIQFGLRNRISNWKWNNIIIPRRRNSSFLYFYDCFVEIPI